MEYTLKDFLGICTGVSDGKNPASVLQLAMGLLLSMKQGDIFDCNTVRVTKMSDDLFHIEPIINLDMVYDSAMSAMGNGT